MRTLLGWISAAWVMAVMPVAAADAAQLEYGIQSTAVSLSTTQAGAHPDLTLRVDLKTDPATGAAFAGTRDVDVALPAGLVAAPAKFPTCPIDQFLAVTELSEVPPCPLESQVGVIDLGLVNQGVDFVLREPLYNLPPPNGSVARFGFLAGTMPKVLDLRIKPEDGYRLHAEIRGLPTLFVMNSAEAVVWGVPSDPSHDAQRLTPWEANECGYPCQAPGFTRPSEFPPIPLMTNPTRCGPDRVGFRLTSYALPGESFEDAADFPPVEGCEQVPFAPATEIASDAETTDSPSGLRLRLGLTPKGFEARDVLASSALRRLILSLPPGYALNPAAAAGTAGCSRSQVGLGQSEPPVFDDGPVACPSASRLGTVSIETPMLGEVVRGSVYLATPGDDSAHSLVPLYLFAEGGGMVVKLRGRLLLDPRSGQVQLRFDDLPPLPIGNLSIELDAGDGGFLTTPATCGAHRGEAELTAWSGAVTTERFSLDTVQGPGGAPCGSLPFSPRFVAGTTSAVAGAASPFVLRIDSAPGEQHLGQFEVKLPKGLVPDISGVTLCAARAASAGACPASSSVGSASMLAGAGPSPLRIPEPAAPPAPVYLAGPEAGAPLSLVAAVPAQAGPFDLGRVVVHAPVYVNRRTARVTVRSQALPQVLDGVPIDYRRLRIKLDRPGFMRNPTSCAPSRIAATLTAVDGDEVSPSASFRVGACGRLRFQPRLSLGLRGAPGKGGHPALAIRLESPAGSESISQLSVLLPAAELLDMRHVKDICSSEDFARGTCRHGSSYGAASASSPLLARLLHGPVRLRESGRRLPDLVASVEGEIGLDLVGRVESLRGRIRVSFADLPAAPFRRLDLALSGGKRGLLVNASDLCRADPRATVVMTGQNGTRRVLHPWLATGCSAAPASASTH